MQKMITITLLLGMTACTSQPPQTLEQKLSGKTLQEQAEVLRLACLNEAEWPIYHSPAYKQHLFQASHPYAIHYQPEVSEMKALCRDMSESTGTDKAALVAACDQKIAAKQQKHGDKGMEHIKRIKEICAKMIIESL